MFEIQFRFMDEQHSENWTWHSWGELGEFETVDLAKKAVLKNVRPTDPKAVFEDVTLFEKFRCKLSNYDGEIYELFMPSNGSRTRIWQFRFLKTKTNQQQKNSPWKIGLNENV